MHCNHCDYPLWNLSARQCPECGEGFKPSDFEFVPNSVKFCCPHCEQDYYGVGETGLLEPRAFICVECSRPVNVDEMVLLPTEEGGDVGTKPGVMPWFERKHRGRVRAFFQTIAMAMIRPHRLIRGVPADSSVGQALVYALLTTIVLFAIGGLIPGVIWLLAYYGIGGMWGGMGGFWWYSLIWLAPMWMLTPLAVFGLMIIWPLVTHLMLVLTGGSRHGIDRTIHAFTYSAGANALSAVPCLGVTFGWIWWLVSAIVMVKAGQRVHTARAMVAVLTFPLLLLLAGGTLFGGGLLLQDLAMNQMMGTTMAGGAWSSQTQETMTINQVVLSSSRQGEESTAHVVELLLSNQVGMWGLGAGAEDNKLFCASDSQTTTDDILVGDGTLTEFIEASRGDRLRWAARLLDSIPDDIVAYRFGDYIFVHNGLSPNTWVANLWTVIMIPDPAVNGEPGPDDPVQVADASYSASEITYAELEDLLDEQNDHRESLGLEPLPDLLTITHDCPALPGATSGDADSQDND